MRPWLLLGAIATACIAVRSVASTPPVTDESLWEGEGASLRELAAASSGTDKGEALFRLGEWERESAQRIRRDIEGGQLASAAGERLIARHLVVMARPAGR
jgi:hypothetical protein